MWGFSGTTVTLNGMHCPIALYLHDESLEADFLEGVGLVAVELQVVVEDQTVLHVTGHLDADGCGA